MLEYNDAYLQKFCTEEREERAIDAVSLYDPDDSFSQTWLDKLAVVQCYILACLENQAQPDDLFSTKLKSYREEFKSMLVQARNSAVDSDGNYGPVFSVPLERG